MATRRKPQPIEVLVEELDTLHADPSTAEAERLIRAALTHKHWMPVEHAARFVAQHSLANFTQELLAVWDRFVDPGPKVDPGCRAKESALIALDALEWFHPEPFLAAIRFTQLEPGYGGATDTAGGVRQRALFGLLRQRHSQALLYAGELLADRLVEVRIGAAEAVCQYAGSNGAALLAQRLHTGDDGRVLLACASGLLELELEYALELLSRWLDSGDGEHHEVAALALGQSKSTRAGELLVAWSERVGLSIDLELTMRALAMHRGTLTREYLLKMVAEGHTTCAREAVRALAEHRYDRQLCERVRAAAAENGDSSLLELVERLYSAT